MKILVIQQKMIGDVLTSSIICENLKKSYPKSIIDYLIYNHTKAVVENNPFIDNLILYRPEYRENKYELWKFIQDLKDNEYDIIIDAYGKLESNLIAFLSNAHKKISYKKWYTKWIYTDVISPSESKDGNGAIESRTILLKPLGIKPSVLRPTIYLTEQEKNRAQAYLKQHSIDSQAPIFMLSILGSSEEKTYPLPYMAQVIQEVVKHSSSTILFNYIPSQENEVNTLYNLCDAHTQRHIRKDLYAPSLREFLALLSQCTALIGNEGGAVNMAKALRIPTFSIFAPFISKKAWNLFADKNNVGVHLYDYLPELKDKNMTKSELYRSFSFECFEQELREFLIEIRK